MNLRQRSSVPNRDDDFMYPGRLSPPASAAAKPKPHLRQRSVSFGGAYQMGDREAAELLLSVTQPTRDRSMSTESFDALSDVVSRELANHQKRQRSLTSTSQTMPPPRAPTAAEMSSEFDKLFGGVPKSRPRNDSAASAPARSGDSKIGVYSVSERIARIKRFHDKRDNRVWKKKIRYSCRKNLADRRVRIKGRFVRATPELLNLIDQEGMTPEKAYAIVAGREAAAALGITTPGSTSSGSPGPTRTPSTRRTGVNTRARRSRSEADGALLRGTAFPPLVRPSQIVEEPSDATGYGGDEGKGGGGRSSGDADPELKAAAALLASSAGTLEAEGDTEMKAEP